MDLVKSFSPSGTGLALEAVWRRRPQTSVPAHSSWSERAAAANLQCPQPASQPDGLSRGKSIRNGPNQHETFVSLVSRLQSCPPDCVFAFCVLLLHNCSPKLLESHTRNLELTPAIGIDRRASCETAAEFKLRGPALGAKVRNSVLELRHRSPLAGARRVWPCVCLTDGGTK